MGLAELVLSSNEKNLFSDISKYIQHKSPNDILSEVRNIKSENIQPILMQNKPVQVEILKKLGLTALEDITQTGTDEIIGYRSLMEEINNENIGTNKME